MPRLRTVGAAGCEIIMMAPAQPEGAPHLQKRTVEMQTLLPGFGERLPVLHRRKRPSKSACRSVQISGAKSAGANVAKMLSATGVLELFAVRQACPRYRRRGRGFADQLIVYAPNRVRYPFFTKDPHLALFLGGPVRCVTTPVASQLTGLSTEKLLEWTRQSELAPVDVRPKHKVSPDKFSWQTILIPRIAVLLCDRFNLDLQALL